MRGWSAAESSLAEVELQAVGVGAGEVQQDLHAGAGVQLARLARVHRQHPGRHAHHRAHVLQELAPADTCSHVASRQPPPPQPDIPIYSQYESGRFHYVGIFDDVLVGLDVGAGHPLGAALRPEDHDGTAHGAYGAFQRKVAVHEHLTLAAHI